MSQPLGWLIACAAHSPSLRWLTSIATALPCQQQAAPPRDQKIARQARELIKTMPKPATSDWWDKYLQEPRSNDLLAELFLLLNESARHEDIVEGIGSALRNNNGQPWMYNVLAMEMKLAEYPQAQIDRVLLSRADFASGDDNQLLITASMMARFDAHEQALEICRNITKINPSNFAAWEVGRRMADKTGKLEHLIWSRAGTLQHVWVDDYQTLHKTCQAELQDAENKLRTAGKSDDAEKVALALKDSEARDLRILVRWAGKADVDLFVTAPDGSVCSYRNRITKHGRLVSDSDGIAEASQRFHEEEFVSVKALPGEYKVSVRFVSGRIVNGLASLQVIRNDNTGNKQVQSTQLRLGEKDAESRVQLKQGRAK